MDKFKKSEGKYVKIMKMINFATSYFGESSVTYFNVVRCFGKSKEQCNPFYNESQQIILQYIDVGNISVVNDLVKFH